jgi:starch synthase
MRSVNLERKLKVLIAASEMSPYAKTGGLADVVGSLPKALSSLGNVDVGTVMPKYNIIDDARYGLKELPGEIRFSMGGRLHEIRVKCVELAEGWKAYFIDSEEYFNRDGSLPYGYHDDAQRFAFFARSILEAAKALNFKPDVIHCNDWHTGLVPTYLKTLYRLDPFFKDTATVFTVHNLAYQGVFPKDILPMLDLGWEEFKAEKLEFWDRISFIKGGLAYSDVINTVSRQYSREIQTPWYGENLDGLLSYRRDVLYGIVNGLDYDVWNPATDQAIAQNYDASSIESKVENKLALQQENDIPQDPQIPLIGVVSRLSYQKGLDIIADAAHDMIHSGIQLVLLGTGDEHYQDRFRRLAYDFPSSVGINLMFSDSMARRIYAGSDMFLMPSRYEPCGLGQLISMRYGTIPIVRKTGGLADTVQDYDPNTGEGTGFCFHDEWSPALTSAVRRALRIYSDKDNWKKLALNAMKADFSWANSAKEYVKLYRKAMQNHNQ